MRNWRLALMFTALGLTSTDWAPAQESADSATTQPAEPTARDYLAVDELSLEIGADAEYQRRHTRSESTRLFERPFSQVNRTHRLEETLSLEGSGHIRDERTLLYDGMVRFGLSQERYEEFRPGPDLARSPDGTLLEYDLTLRALPAGKISATAHASKLDDRLPRPFLPSLDRRRERYGVELSYNDAKLPMQLSYEHLFDDITSRTDQFVDDEEQGEDTLRYEAAWQPTDEHTLSLEYEYERRSDRYSGTRTRFDTVRNYFNLDDVIRFGPKQRSQFETRVRVEDEQGDLDRDVLELAPSLRLQHTDNLYSTYRGQFLRQEFEGFETQTSRADVGLTHEWQRMLTSSVGFYALRQDTDQEYDMREWGGTLDLSFRREHTGGTFSSSLSYLHSRSATNDSRRNGIVIDEAATFRDPLPVFLSQRYVNRLFIVVRDPERFTVYLDGVDYWVVQRGDATALLRNPLGRITDRQTVLVSYTYRTYDDYEVVRDRVDLRVQDDLKIGLTPYYAASLQDEQINDQELLPFDDRNINRHRAGFTYRRADWSIGPEYEYNDDSIDPYQAGHVNGDVTLFRSAPHVLTADVRGSYFDFRGSGRLEGRFTTLVDMGLTHRYTLGQQLETSAAAKYRFQNDSLFGETQGVDLSASLSYRIGEFMLLLEVEYDMLDLPTSSDDSIGVWLKLRRTIPIIGQRTRR